MTALRSRPVNGFTLVELLVVAGLMAGMLGLVLATSRPDPGVQLRRFSQSVSSSILATQTRALGNESGAALVIAAPSGISAAASELFFADIPPAITGSISALPNIPIISGTAGVLTLSPDNADSVENGYRIRFLNAASVTTPRTPWFRFSASGTATGTVTGTASFDAAVSQTARNTIWPMTSGSSMAFQLGMFPRASTPAFPVIKQAGIDLRYSGVGDDPASTFGKLEGTTPICICFDRTGRLDCLIGSLPSQPQVPFTPTSPLYLLLASLVDIEADRALQSEASRWLVITPGTGRTSLAKNLPQTGGTPADVKAARLHARAGVGTGGR
jgi:type II secretory pathway pseudopilin PulG